MRHLAEVLLDQAPHITALPGLCKRRRFRKSECRRCVEVCPDDVIALDPGPSVRAGCADCGLCLTACPTDAFRDERHSDQQLLDHVLSQLGPGRSPGDPVTLTIHCHRAPGRVARMWRIPCVGRITETMIVGIALASGATGLEIIRGRCSECRFRHGEKVLARSVAAARLILEALGRDGFAILSREEDQARPLAVGRREFFADLSRGAQDRAAGLLSLGERTFREALGRPPSHDGAGRESRRALLEKFLGEAGRDRLRPVRSGRECPWGKVRIDATRCSGCGACDALCPTGAILQRQEDGHVVLRFKGAACINCGLCQEACPARAIDFEDDAPVAEALDPEPVVVARIRLGWCEICGGAMAGEGGDVCATCRKRQLRPVQVVSGASRSP